MTFKNYYKILNEGKHRSKFMEEIGFTKRTPDFLEDDIDSENEYSIVTPDYNVEVTLSKDAKGWTALTKIQYIIKNAMPDPAYASELESHFLKFLISFDLHKTFSFIDDPDYDVFASNDLKVEIWGDTKGRTLDELQNALFSIQHNLQLFKKSLYKELKNFLSHYDILNKELEGPI